MLDRESVGSKGLILRISQIWIEVEISVTWTKSVGESLKMERSAFVKLKKVKGLLFFHFSHFQLKKSYLSPNRLNYPSDPPILS